MKTVYYCDAPIGRIGITADDDALTYIWLPGHTPPADYEERGGPLAARAAAQLAEYFAGERRVFDLPLRFEGTAFQKQVWDALLEIPYGETRSYADIARRIGRPSACRAVGAANGRNPLSIIAPCHRVIGSGGTLTGYAGGLDMKTALLRLEGAL